MSFQPPEPRPPHETLWKRFYQKKERVKTKRGRFCVYVNEKMEAPSDQWGDLTPVAVLIHGGGMSSMSWASCALILRKYVTTISIDLRGHGDTKCKDEYDLSVQTLSLDVKSVLQKYFGGKNVFYTLIGHSIGGSVAAHTAKLSETDRNFKVSGLCVIDLVEGSAMESFSALKKTLKERPRKFEKMSEAVLWNLKITQIDIEQLKISTPSQLVFKKKKNAYVWRTPLEKSEPHWKTWYHNLSKLFLSLRIPKQLLIANMERLDTPLTIAHMQGKFKLDVVYGTKHFLHEEKPNEACEKILEFLNRFSLIRI